MTQSGAPVSASATGPKGGHVAGLGPRPKVGTITKALYGFGSVAFGIKDNGFRVFLLLFYNQVVGLPASQVALAIMVAMLIDCLIDPVIGHVSDNWRSRWGRRHPFMYAAALPVALSFLLLWNPPLDWDPRSLFWYLVVVTVVVRTFITLYEIPSSAMTAELTTSYDDRSSLLGWRYFFAWWGGLSLTVVMFFVFLAPTAEYPVGQLNRDGYARYGEVAAVLMFISIIVSAASTHRFIPWLPQPAPDRGLTFGQTVKEVGSTLAIRPFIAITLVGLFAAIAQGVSFSLAFYFATYFWELSSAWTGFLVLESFVASAVALMAAPMLTRRAGKKLGGAVLLAASVLIGFIPLMLRLLGLFPDNGVVIEGTQIPQIVPWLLLDGVIRGILGITAAILITAMLADVVEYSEERTGRRSEGLFFASTSLVQKAVSGVGVMVAGLLLTLVEFPQGARPSEVDPAVIRNLALVYMPTLIVLYGAALAVMQAYNITRQTHADTLAVITARAEAAEGTMQTPL
ncbi:MAG: MFS transporter [Caulobacter sp.]|nr:MFS transporter [Caulobacter sp.]